MDKKRVLIIEDEKELLDSFSEILEDSGYETTKCEDGYKALEVLKSRTKDFDVILLDLMMPNIDGLEVLRMINSDKVLYGQTPIIILTNMSSERVIKESFELGAVSYLIKSELEYKDLVYEVNKVVGV
jgi:CheY-like chemotaxis protein